MKITFKLSKRQLHSESFIIMHCQIQIKLIKQFKFGKMLSHKFRSISYLSNNVERLKISKYQLKKQFIVM